MHKWMGHHWVVQKLSTWVVWAVAIIKMMELAGCLPQNLWRERTNPGQPTVKGSCKSQKSCLAAYKKSLVSCSWERACTKSQVQDLNNKVAGLQRILVHSLQLPRVLKSELQDKEICKNMFRTLSPLYLPLNPLSWQEATVFSAWGPCRDFPEVVCVAGWYLFLKLWHSHPIQANN